MSDRKALAREIAARSRPRFIEIKPEPRRKLPLTKRTIEVPRERRSGVPFTEGGADRHPRWHDSRGISPLPHPHFLERLKRKKPRSGGWPGLPNQTSDRRERAPRKRHSTAYAGAPPAFL